MTTELQHGTELVESALEQLNLGFPLRVALNHLFHERMYSLFYWHDTEKSRIYQLTPLVAKQVGQQMDYSLAVGPPYRGAGQKGRLNLDNLLENLGIYRW